MDAGDSSSRAACRPVLTLGPGLGPQRTDEGRVEPERADRCDAPVEQEEVAAWGWLDPDACALPFTLLRGEGVAIGRGGGPLAARCQPGLPALAAARSTSLNRAVAAAALQRSASGAMAGAGTAAGVLRALSQPFGRAQAPAEPASSGGGGGGGDGLATRANCNSLPPSFVTIPDTRVSSLHCVIRRHLRPHTGQLGALLEDHSSNGTFVNGQRLEPGQGVWLEDGDRVSLVLSVSPLAEQYFIFKQGCPDAVLVEGSCAGVTRTAGIAPAAANGGGSECTEDPSSPSRAVKRLASALLRMPTTRYLTACSSRLEELQCCLCLDTLRDCVALEPCGHNFCATCASNHFGSQVQQGRQLSCPLRCGLPSSIVANQAVRSLVQRLGAVQQAGEEGQGAAYGMHPLCPLGDEDLPLRDARSLKDKQLSHAVDQLLEPEALEEDDAKAALDTLRNLAWTDQDVRKQVREGQGIEGMVDTMLHFASSLVVQHSACEAVMSMLGVGEGEVDHVSQWFIGHARGVEAVTAAMRNFLQYEAMQKVALVCLALLATGSPILKAHVAACAAEEVLQSMRCHASSPQVQLFGLNALVLLVADDTVSDNLRAHNTMRQQLLQLGVPCVLAAVLQEYGRQNDQVLHKCVTLLAYLLMDTDDGSALINIPAAKALSSYGVIMGLAASLTALRGRVDSGVDTLTLQDGTVLDEQGIREFLDTGESMLGMLASRYIYFILGGLLLALPLVGVVLAVRHRGRK